MRRITRSGDKAERQHALGLHAGQPGADHRITYLGVRHVAQVAQQRQGAQLVFAEQSLPGFALVRAGGERHLPGIGRGQFVRHQALPQIGLGGVHRLGVAEEEHVTQLHRSGAVVLGQRVLVKPGEGRGQPLLYLRGKRLLALAPVERDEFGEFVGALDDAKQGLRHQMAVRGQTRHLAHQQKRSVTQLHLFPRLHRQGRHLFRSHPGHQLADASGDRHAILVKLVFPQHAGQNGAAQLLLGGDVLCRSALMRTLPLHPGQSQIEYVRAGHVCSSLPCQPNCEPRASRPRLGLFFPGRRKLFRLLFQLLFAGIRFCRL